MSEAAPENNNPWMLSKEQAREENPFIRGEAGEKVQERKAPFSRPAFIRKEEARKQEILREKEKATIDHPLKFKGSSGGGTIRTKLFSFVVGRKSGRKDFKAYGGKKSVREGLKELRGEFVSKTGGTYIRRNKAQIEATKLGRKLSYLRGDEHTAASKFLKELEDKTGIKPKI